MWNLLQKEKKDCMDTARHTYKRMCFTLFIHHLLARKMNMMDIKLGNYKN